MGFFKKLSNKVENWLMKDEIDAFNNQSYTKLDLPPDVIEELDVIHGVIEKKKKYIEDQLKIITSEDHSIKPTQYDINRYFEYHIKYVDVIKRDSDSKGVWSTLSVMDEEDFKSKGRVEGWDFLRLSCGLPSGVIPLDENKNNGWNTK